MKRLAIQSCKQSFLGLCVALLVAQSTNAQVLLDFNENDINYFHTVPLGGGCTTNGLQNLLGHTLPTERGGTGYEEEINDQGQVKSAWGTGSGYIAFDENVRNAPTELKQAYMDYYITMRWNYTALGWDGFENAAGIEEKEFYAGGSSNLTPEDRAKNAPRVLVTNPETGRSIIAVVLEYGPAPWTGVLIPPSSLLNAPDGETDAQKTERIKQLRAWLNERTPEYWKTPQTGTPEGYTGRVSGFPPKAIEALGATQRMQDGGGHELLYSWAPDQHAVPGPLPESEAKQAADGASICSGRTMVIDGLTYAFPVAPQTKIRYGDLPCAYEGCHAYKPEYEPNSTAAFDLLYGPDGTLDGKPVYAITDGVVHVKKVPYSMSKTTSHPECRSLHLYADEAYGGHHYWYGHIMNVVDEELAKQPSGKRVKAGDKIAEVARNDFGTSCVGGRDHLHIDRGFNGRDGGGGNGRDRTFVDFFNKMWEMLPEG